MAKDKKVETKQVSPEEIAELEISDGVEGIEISEELEKVPGETKEQLFKRVAERRVKNALRQIKLLGNCANKHSYGYTTEQAQKIVAIIKEAAERLRFQFEKTKSSVKDEFSL